MYFGTTEKFGQPHRARDCSKKEKLNNALIVVEVDHNESETPTRVNALQLLNVI